MASAEDKDTAPVTGRGQGAYVGATGSMLEPGGMLESYRVQRLLGRGGMSEVYLARDETLERDVALKLLNPRVEGVDEALQRFLSEARAIARLSHPHIVQIFAFNPDATPPFLVMEYIPGGPLSEAIGRQALLSVPEALDCARQMLEALAAAHDAGIVHRDVKPGNVLLAGEGQYKLGDFGLARSFEAKQKLTATGSVVGTVHYLAPEVARGETASPQSDLYSLGATLYEAICGHPPYDEESPLKLIHRIASAAPPPLRSRLPDLPAAVEQWLGRLMAWDQTRRFAHAWEALSALTQVRSQRNRSPMDSTALYPKAPQVDVALKTSGTDWPEHEADTQSRRATPLQATQATPDAASPGPGRLPDAQVESVLLKMDEIVDQIRRVQKREDGPLTRTHIREIAVAAGVAPEAVRQTLKWHRRHHDSREKAFCQGRRRGLWLMGGLALLLAALACIVLAQSGALLERRVHAPFAHEWAHTREVHLTRDASGTRITQLCEDGTRRAFELAPDDTFRKLTESLPDGRQRIVSRAQDALRVSVVPPGGEARQVRQIPVEEADVDFGTDRVRIAGAIEIGPQGLRVLADDKEAGD